MPTPGQIAAGIAAAAFGLYAFTRKKNTVPTTQPVPVIPAQPVDPSPPSNPGGIATGNKYVGAPGYSWPRKDRFPTQLSFQEFLRFQNYGASTSGNVRDAQTRSAVAAFQSDYNLVAERILDGEFSQSTPRLSVDQDIGPNTIAAMIYVQDVVNPHFAALGTSVTSPWPVLVAQAKNTGPSSVGS